MIRIETQFDAGKYTLLGLDFPPPLKWNKKVEIDGIEYETEVAYDLKNSIGIVGKGNFVGKEIKFI